MFDNQMHYAKLLLVKVILSVQNLILDGFKAVLFASTNKPKKILIVRAGSIGDNVCAMPAIAAIRNHFDDAQIHILTKANTGVTLDQLISPAYYDCLINYGSVSKMGLLKMIRHEKYDLVIALPQDMTTLYLELRAIIFFWLANIGSGFGCTISACHLFKKTQEEKMLFQRETDRLLNVLRKNGVTCTDGYTYPLNVTDKDHSIVDKLLQSHFSKKEMERRFVAVIPGAKRPQNRYPLDRFEELVQWLSEKNYSIVIIGGPEDYDRGKVLAHKGAAISFCGKLSPVQSTTLLMRCSIAVSNDTGPMHLSYAVGTPVIAIFSARDFRRKWYPSRGNISIRDNSAPCSICLTETCTNNICMQVISVDRIKKAFIELERRADKTKAPESAQLSRTLH